MTTPTRLEFPIAKAQYLFASATEPGKGDDTKRQFHRLFLTLKTSGPKNTVFLSQSLSVTGKISINVGTPDLLPGYVRPEARTQTQQC